jgi:hypothetical protein
MFKRHLMMSGATIFRAPENDEGHDDGNEAFSFEDDDLTDFEDQDDGGDQDDDAGEAGDDDQDDDDAPRERQAKKPSRAQQRIQTVQREVREARERADRLEREMTELRTQRTQPSAAEQAAAERDLLATMTPEERIEYRLDKQERLNTQRAHQLQIQTADIADRADFNARCAGNKTLASIATKVEEAVSKARAQGSTTDRMTIAKYLIGEMLMEKGAKVGTKQRRQAANNREREQGRPGGARSDTRANSGKLDDAAARRKRLDGQLI